VEIDAKQNPDKTFTAIRIEIDQDKHLSELEGKIEKISVDSITVGGTVVKVDSHTTIRSEAGPIALADLKVGDQVQVKAQRNADGTLLAIDIKVENEDGEQDTEEVQGVVTEVTPTSMTVKTEEGHSVTVAITADTVVKKGDQTAAVADIKVGQKVEIKATRNPDGTFTATSIKIDDGEGDD
jgi:hypothetical protein